MTDASVSRRALLRGGTGLGLGLLAAPALTACGTASSTPVTSGPVDISLWTHDPGYITTFETAVTDAHLMRAPASTSEWTSPTPRPPTS